MALRTPVLQSILRSNRGHLILASLFLTAGLSTGCGGDGGTATGPNGSSGPGTPASLEISTGPLALHALGDSAQLAAMVADAGGITIPDATVAWATTDTTVATVGAAGWVVAQANGQTDVVATSGALADTVRVTVSQRAASVVLSQAAVTLAQDDSVVVEAQAWDANNVPIPVPSVTWSTSHTGTVAVEARALKGAGEAVVRALRGGEAVVTARVHDATATLDARVLDRLAFVVTISGITDIYTIDENGHGLTNLTKNTASDSFPVWSPDGARIAFVSRRNGNQDIYVMNANGRSPTRLTTHAADDYQPAWSPDGSRIAFVSARHGNPEIYVMNADGSGQTRLTNNTNNDRLPVWSPDGSTIAFNDIDDIYLIGASGGGVTNLTNGALNSGGPIAWAPDGQRLAFANYPARIHVINVDGTDLTHLTANGGGYSPRWSPDGERIAFFSHRDGNFEVYVMNGDGTGLATNLSNHVADDRHPVWSPDGTRIAFLSNRSANPNELHLMNADGTDVVQLTFNAAEESLPTWRPRP
jgi:Tol biopolymer transport system component